jgi:hypothetical protein
MVGMVSITLVGEVTAAIVVYRLGAAADRVASILRLEVVTEHCDSDSY